MKKSDLVKIINEELKGYSPQIGQTNGLTVATLNKILLKIAKEKDKKEVSEIDNPVDRITVDIPLFIRLMEFAKEDAKTDMDLHDVAEKAIKLGSVQNVALSMEDYDSLVSKEEVAEKKKPGLWANINAKRKRGEKPSHGNSNAHKDAVAAGNAMKEEEVVEDSSKSKPTLDSQTGLIYYFDIPFTTEDISEILNATKVILNAKLTPNKQFEIQPMIYIKDKVNGGQHTFSLPQLAILIGFHSKNKDKVASRKDFVSN